MDEEVFAATQRSCVSRRLSVARGMLLIGIHGMESASETLHQSDNSGVIL